ncbi:hypothetical protein ADH76_29845 [Enterocloster clostridioformis]|uniref:hypothetical protein n=1 Tax=Enterocloster clostridioformis TaxID=1531 RepID=UPI00080C5677|nr:hypothetical protein [Enterocloster clostridioformis]ANU46957.1 hypothetical protein A4V08_15210 [Lachnoclostridium sp. YL32]NDO32523.1 hypothetical protein [Enterocloster clostridioformis]OXE62800.1 hypothetical protein ADH76_29845 [Enterocloster clostridioformis]QQQ98332.1 hypothetical protein I5Q83_19395 [Enterocloster clostridioformis]
MKNIQDIIRALNTIELPNGEVLYSFVEFYEVIKKTCGDYVSTDDCIITPYYVLGERRMELYEYELNIRLVESPNFEKYLLRKTGKFKVDDIPEEVILLQRNCYFEVLKTENKISKQKIKQYIDFLYNNNCLKHQIKQAFGKFKKEQLLFEFY